MFQTDLAQETNMQPANPFDLLREHVLQFSLFLEVCGGFRIRQALQHLSTLGS